MQFKDPNGITTTIYSPNERQGIFIWALKQAFNEISKTREAIIRLFIRDFVSQFRQRIFGYLWAILLPLFSVSSFLFLYFTGILNPGVEKIPYPLYILMGTNIWSCLSGTIGIISGSLLAQTDLIMRTNIPKLALAISSLASILYGVIVNMITVGIFFIIYGIIPTWWFILYPILILPMLILGASLGIVLSVVGTIARDFSQMIIQGISLFMYLTPVVYRPDNINSFLIKKIISLNPLSYLVDVPRALIFSGTSPHITIYLWIFLGTIITSIVMLQVFYLLEDLVAERL
jgi:lipopolysaccharide transport system permease protein